MTETVKCFDRLKHYNSNVISKFGASLETLYSKRNVIALIENVPNVNNETGQVLVLLEDGLEIVTCKESEVPKTDYQVAAVDMEIVFVPFNKINGIEERIINSNPNSEEIDVYSFKIKYGDTYTTVHPNNDKTQLKLIRQNEINNFTRTLKEKLK